jgi:hypothetical protein
MVDQPDKFFPFEAARGNTNIVAIKVSEKVKQISEGSMTLPPPSSLLSFLSLHEIQSPCAQLLFWTLCIVVVTCQKKNSQRFVSSVVQWLECLPLDTRVAGSHPAEAMDS